MTDPWTIEQALEHARRIWAGQGAWVEFRARDLYGPCWVGVMQASARGPVKRRLGRGLTWQRAFTSADLERRGVTRPRRGRREIPGTRWPQMKLGGLT